MNDGERSYKNDGFNRVTQVKTTTGQVQINRYDAEGLRYEMEENKKLVQFIFNENREVVVEQSDSDIKRLIRSYDLWASECEPEKTWYHYASDEQGSIIFITDEEKICNKYDYDAWGNLTTCEEIIPNRFLYTGQQFDQITQQYYLRARYYNPVIARFTKEDVYRGDGLNLYTYCDNNPVVYYDPSGYKLTNCQKNIYNKLKQDYPNMTSSQRFLMITGKTPLKDKSPIIMGNLDSLGRATGVVAHIDKNMIKTGSKPKSSIRPPGFKGGKFNHARGHLLANQLGGSGKDNRNLVTIYQTPVNTPIMRRYEKKIRTAVEKGETVNYMVIPQYSGNAGKPSSIKLIAKGNKGFNLDVTIRNKIERTKI